MTTLRIAKEPARPLADQSMSPTACAPIPASRVEAGAMSTRGDEVLDRSLARRSAARPELELAMARRGGADCAVHSLRTTPMGWSRASRWPRSLAHAPTMPMPSSATASTGSGRCCRRKACVGTSSLRRQITARAAPRPATARPARQREHPAGQAGCRQCDAIVLACAGLQRLGLRCADPRTAGCAGLAARARLGAGAIECRTGDDAVAALCAAGRYRDPRLRRKPSAR